MNLRIFLKNIRNFGLWFVGTYLVVLLTILIVFLVSGVSMDDIKVYFPYTAKEIIVQPISWVFLAVPYALFRLLKYLLHTWKNYSRLIFIKRISYIVLLPTLLLFSGLNLSKWYTQSEVYNYNWDDSVENQQGFTKNRYAIDGKQRGMHLFGRSTMEEQTIEDLLKTNIEWITLVPFGWQENYESEKIGRRHSDYSKWTGRDSSFMKKVEILKAKGFYIMIKPHIWLGKSDSGKWRSDISPKTKEGWENWSESYRKFIFHYAKMSQLYEVDLFCIGTELHATVKEHPEFWIQLIKDIRKIYSGEITYAANWNAEADDVKFWDQLDYIGIQAYYPLTDKIEPSVKNLKKGWKKHVDQIEKLHHRYNKPILFSELGYKSTPDAGIEPWVWANAINSLYKKVSYKTQANCYEAFFQTFWKKDWFDGVHFWEWQASRNHHRKRKDINFTPQQKPAENIMTKWFGRMGNK